VARWSGIVLCRWLTHSRLLLLLLLFPSPALYPSDADIEAILQKGERETADLNDKLNKFTESAKQFTMDGGVSLYDYKEEVNGVPPKRGGEGGGGELW
jgi:hypothetical protein